MTDKNTAKPEQVAPKSAEKPVENHAAKADGTPAVPNTPAQAQAKPAARGQDKAQTDPAQTIAYDQGRQARAHGISRDDAPYTADTSELAAWLKGYKFEEDNERT